MEKQSQPKYNPAGFESKLPRTTFISFRGSSPCSQGLSFRGKQDFSPQSFEKKWQQIWEKEKIYTPDVKKARKPYYNLMMFPYPSAEGLHVGNMYAFTGVDIWGRFMRMNGYDVFEPIGLDGFGIHSENYALKVNRYPKEQAQITEKKYYDQLQSTGISFDWTRTLETYDPDYYRWTQWLFVQMFKHGLAYRAKAKVNWCPSCKTVLADEQVIQKTAKQLNGETVRKQLPSHSKSVSLSSVQVCERCGTEVERKKLEQWFFRITDYADRLLQNTYKPSFKWSEKVKTGQRNWIGKSTGLTIDFYLETTNKKIPIWTKFWETIFGTTFLVLTPEHPLLQEITLPDKYNKQLKQYIKESQKKKNEARRVGEEKTGVFTGLYAVNPVNQEKVPIWVADYVLMEVGTGAVMGVPAHDERDFLFARKYKLRIKKVVDVQVEMHSIVIKNSVSADFISQIEKNNWFWMDFTGWGYRIVVPKGDEKKYIDIVINELKFGPWYVHTDGSVKAVIFKNRVFYLPDENEAAKKYAREIGIPSEQIGWDDKDNYLFCHAKGGLIVNSAQFDGLDAWTEGKKQMAQWMIEEKFAVWESRYHLRDWLISRQRYWGAPIPMVYCKLCAEKNRSWLVKHSHLDQSKGSSEANKKETAFSLDSSSATQNDITWAAGWWPVTEDQLPVLLPDVKNWKPTGTGRGPLAGVPEFYQTTCPECGSAAVRETDVCDTFLDSSWYYLRYPALENQKPKLKSQKYKHKVKNIEETTLPWDKEVLKKWLPVDSYIGGAEHTVLHLLYTRFVYMALKDWGYLEIEGKETADFNPEEPFRRFYAHGLIIKDGAKMSKSKGNVVIPDEYIAKYGADTLRTYLMFLGPFDSGGDFRDTGIAGMYRWLSRVWRLSQTQNSRLRRGQAKRKTQSSEGLKLLHQTINGVTQDLEGLRYNTAIAKLMEFVNWWKDHPNEMSLEMLADFLKLLAPFAPYMTEEIWYRIKGKPDGNLYQVGAPQRAKSFGNDKSALKSLADLSNTSRYQSIHLQSWPKFDPGLIKEEVIKVVVQINGKTRAVVDVALQEANSQPQVEQLVKASAKVQKYLQDKNIQQVIFIPRKLINFVVS